MFKQTSSKGLLFYVFVALLAHISFYFVTRAALLRDPASLEQLSEQLGMAVSVNFVALLSVGQNFVLVLVMLAIGLFTAHKVGLTSVILHRGVHEVDWRDGLKLAVIIGIGGGIVIRGFDFVFQGLLPASLLEQIKPYTALELIMALLYGGVVEELLVRFGLLSLIVFILWKLLQRKSVRPANWMYIAAIIVSALLFALGHYGATAAMTEMTPFIWFRMLFLNGIVGIAFGWLYWKKNLELAMIAHGVTHITMHVIMLVFGMFS